MIGNTGRRLGMLHLVMSLAGVWGIWTSTVALGETVHLGMGTSRGLKYGASLRKSTFKPLEPIRLETEFKNGSGEPVTIWLSGYWPNHQIIVKDLTGNEPILTKDGEARRRAFAPAGARDKNSPRILKSGEIYREGGVDLDRLYNLSSNRYTVQIIYQDDQAPTPLKVASETLSFEIK